MDDSLDNRLKWRWQDTVHLHNHLRAQRLTDIIDDWYRGMGYGELVIPVPSAIIIPWQVRNMLPTLLMQREIGIEWEEDPILSIHFYWDPILAMLERQDEISRRIPSTRHGGDLWRQYKRL